MATVVDLARPGAVDQSLASYGIDLARPYAQLGDGTVANGNARGTGATDWQQVRAAATQVASAAGAFIGAGQNNTASGIRAVAVGGNGNLASGGESVTVGGISNAASGQWASVVSGTDNAANGQASWIPGGRGANSRSLIGRGAWASGTFVTPGDAQAVEMVLRGRTTDATPVVLTADNTGAASTTNTYILANNSVGFVRVIVATRDSTGAGKLTWVADVQTRRDANAASTLVSVGVAVTTPNGTTTGWAVAVTADTTVGGMIITVTGAAATNMNWVARVSGVEVICAA